MSEVTRFLAPSNPLRRAGYRYLMSFSLLVAMGGGFHFIGSYWILYTDTSSPSSVAWLILAYWVPSLFVMPFAGVLVDRWNRRLILAATCAYLATLSSAVAVIMVTGHFQVEYLYLYGALSSLAHGVYWNALLAYLKDSLTTEELLHANSLNTALFQGGYLLGAGLAGILFYWIDALGCFAIDAASLSIGVLGWLTITRWFADKTHFRDASTKSSFLIDYWEGLQHVRSDWPLFLFALFAIVPRISAQMLNVLVVGFSKDVLSAGSAGFGVLDMAYGFGAMGCGFGLPLFLRRFKLRATLPTVALVGAAISCLAVSFTENLATAAVVLACFGACAHTVGILANTALQREASPEVIGRITSTIQVCQYLMIPPIIWWLGEYASMEQGRLIHQVVLRDSFVAGSVLLLCIAGISLVTAYPFLRRSLADD
ncbi:MAG: MFS transporter [Planctomycetaceae bacterium]|nr:MFS transporter [Planctomycetales bacterium]MCB9927704.1 MFS transporter [Planctomycetaceae bacterium]